MVSHFSRLLMIFIFVMNIIMCIMNTITFLGAATGSPYVVFKLAFSYGFMLRKNIYI